LLKNILADFGYSPTSPFFLLLSEHKHCDNIATNLNSENAKSRMVESLRGSVGLRTKEDESSTGRVWAARVHHVMARSCLVRILKLKNRLFLSFSKFSGRSKPRIQGSACILFSEKYILCWHKNFQQFNTYFRNP